MKKFIYPLISMVLFFSCKKDSNHQNGDSSTFPVVFTVSTSAKAADPESSTPLDVLYYHVYDTDKKLVHKKDIKYVAGQPITDTLPRGNYTAIIVIGKTGLVYNSPTYAGDLYFNDITTYYGPNVPTNFPANFGYHDFYALKYDFTVNGITQKSLNIERTPALVTIDVSGTIDASVDTVGVNIISEKWDYLPTLGSCDTAGWDQRVYKLRKDASTFKANPQFAFYLINTLDPVMIQVVGINKSGAVVKTTNNLAAKLNKNDDLHLAFQLH